MSKDVLSCSHTCAGSHTEAGRFRGDWTLNARPGPLFRKVRHLVGVPRAQRGLSALLQDLSPRRHGTICPNCRLIVRPNEPIWTLTPMQQPTHNSSFSTSGSSRVVAASPAKTCPGEIRWHYRRAELIADGVIHAIGLTFGILGTIGIVVTAVGAPKIEITPILIYTSCLVAMLGLSAAVTTIPIV